MLVCRSLTQKTNFRNFINSCNVCLELVQTYFSTHFTFLCKHLAAAVTAFCGVKSIMDNIDENNVVPLYFKSGATDSNTLFCEVEDADLQFAGDSGAIGRMYSDENAIRIDLKGRQYHGSLHGGPTIMVLNIGTGVFGANSSSANAKLVAKVEAISNEFCSLEFERDQHEHLVGVYSGADLDGLDVDDDYIANGEAAGISKKAKQTNSRGGAKSESKSTKAAPVISTVTQRRRNPKAKKSSTGSKKS